MKFIELCNGDLFNMDEVKRIFWTSKDRPGMSVYFSHIEDKGGIQYDFLDFPNTISFESIDGDTIKDTFDAEHAYMLHYFALSVILDCQLSVIPYDHLETAAWNLFMTAIKEQEKRSEEANK